MLSRKIADRIVRYLRLKEFEARLHNNKAAADSYKLADMELHEGNYEPAIAQFEKDLEVCKGFLVRLDVCAESQTWLTGREQSDKELRHKVAMEVPKLQNRLEALRASK